MSSCLLASCSTQISSYAEHTPKLVLEEFLNGHISGTGIISNWKGEVTQQFDFEGHASWKDHICTFNETMRYDDGREDRRTWIITKINDTHYEGRTEQVIGVAKIVVQGNAMNWQYQMDIKVNNQTYRLTFDDWMYLMNNQTLVNQNAFKKFGLTVGSLTLIMRKETDKHEKA